MNKIQKAILAVLGGIDAVFNFIFPLILGLLFLEISTISQTGKYLFFSVCIVAAIFRAIKVGWLKG